MEDNLVAFAFETNPLHLEVSKPFKWSRVNIGEAVPGICTPLGFSFWYVPQEMGVRRGYYALGAMAASEVVMPRCAEDRTLGAFYGRTASNVTLLEEPFNRVLGFSADAAQSVMLGATKDATSSVKPPRKSYAQTAWALTRIAWCVGRMPAWHRALSRDIISWWKHVVGTGIPKDAAAAIVVLTHAHDLFVRVFAIHMVTGVLTGAFYGQLAKLAAAAGHPGLETSLVAGLGDVHETRSLFLLWDAAHGRCAYQEFIREYGFHGPDEGQISAPSWREDPTLLDAIIKEIAGRGEEGSPKANEQRQIERRIAAERMLLNDLPFRWRAWAKLTIALAKRCTPLRENGKACFLRAIDAGRCAARVIGQEMAANGVLTGPDDIFYLTYGEITGGALAEDPAEIQDRIARRKAQRAEYCKLDLPFEWTGMPSPIQISTRETSRTGKVEGQGVSPGVVEGRVHVVNNPASDTSMEAGDILVCPMTDPSWASLLMLASGAVVDMGGALSHGAVVARELGIPCIMNTGNGSRTLRTGDIIRIDGARGSVEILEAVIEEKAACPASTSSI